MCYSCNQKFFQIIFMQFYIKEEALQSILIFITTFFLKHI